LFKDTQAVTPIIIITCIAVLLIAVITASFITAIVIIVRSKAKIKMELEHTKIRMNTEIYEEIDCNEMSDSASPGPVDTNKNIAYAEVSKK
jgi:hypothetical protein